MMIDDDDDKDDDDDFDTWILWVIAVSNEWESFETVTYICKKKCATTCFGFVATRKPLQNTGIHQW